MKTEELLEMCFGEYAGDDFNWVNSVEELVQTPGFFRPGIHCVTLTDEWMPMIFENGELLIAGYESTRGSLYQRGAYIDGHFWSSNNLDEEEVGWVEKHSICADIAYGLWKDIKNARQ